MNNIPTITKNLLIINVLMYLATVVLQMRFGIELSDYLGLHFFMASDFKVWQLFTYMFMHGSFMHVFFNMFAVWMFGRILEQMWGKERFLFFYLVCGIGAGLVQELVQFVEYEMTLSQYQMVDMGYTKLSMDDYLNLLTTVGASGSVYGILLGFGMTFPEERIFIFPLPIPIKAKYFVVIYAIVELLEGFAQFDNIAHFAHLGGMIFGYLLIRYWRNRRNSNGYYYQ
ncbi:MAG: rhomboid family intramembrane serine protease [Bacteroidaceae bacterium]|nr:rhomboid family intramembrane serine protease [Bacteroidaceae bacterium]